MIGEHLEIRLFLLVWQCVCSTTVWHHPCNLFAQRMLQVQLHDQGINASKYQVLQDETEL
jgi:hypothetical protein